MTHKKLTQAETTAMLDKFDSEEQFLQWVINAAVQLGWDRELIYHTRDSRKSTPGFPDLVMVRPEDRRLLFAELKIYPETQKRGQLTGSQQKWLRALRDVSMARQDYLFFFPEAYIWRPEDMDRILEVLA